MPESMTDLRRKLDRLGDTDDRTAQPRAVTVLDFGSMPNPPDQDITHMFSRNQLLDMAEHPTTIAMVAAARQQAAQPPYEQSAPYKTITGQIRVLLADTPKAVRQSMSQARARFVEIDQALTNADAELERIRAVRPSDLGKLDSWARESSAVGQKRDRLIELHSQAAGDVATARTALLAAMHTAAEQRRATAATATAAAQQAVQRTQQALVTAQQAEQAANQLVVRVRDQGNHDQHVDAVLQEV